ncbi:Outer membrane protein beta-barrel domain-containing protein [Filimonas lacunae]|uniref:Outer membrane protein beta-barrel domain-containing protein n=1 Tax=Filimonas lacunae TaxID=477680 RepID=A0A173ML88_9BACT|nr:outer membrane beta-barrel protein [Filimonas lacunae]BAV08168.1 hypothetical protein FLA_4201 [Filimonas lacunae]SIT10281.1 Outer membrane protein beta-barrel domain-containing protein [Filimonas lacunae]
MKKILLLTVLVVITTAITASAQINKGSVYLGGNVGYGRSNIRNNGYEDYKQINVGVSPSVAFAYKDNFAWGLSLLYARTDLQTSYIQKSNNFGVTAFLRQYQPLGKGFYAFAQEGLTLLYGFGNQSSPTSSEVKSYGANAGISPGLAYDINKKFQLEIQLNNVAYVSYNRSKTKYSYTTDQSTTSDFNIGSNLSQISDIGSVSIGARFVFGR